MFCFHKWEEIGRFHAIATVDPEDFEIRGNHSDVQRIYQELFFGLTTIEQKCTKCGLTRFDSTPGIGGKISSC